VAELERGLTPFTFAALKRGLTPFIFAALALALSACGEKAEPGTPTLTVSAAASLKPALEPFGRAFAGARVRAQFAGSNELAAQIERGIRPDVFAAANVAVPRKLHAQGLVEAPRVFAGNELVLAVPADGRVRSLDDLTAGGLRIAIGAEGVPVGDYARTMLDRLGGARERRILAAVASEEPDVAGIVGKLTQGSVDAGFVYASDVKATNGRLRAIRLAERLRPHVAYAAAVVTDAPHPELARRYVDALAGGAGQDALRAAGFLPPPG
jgi:molybdate transport system substrate-binding protein